MAKLSVERALLKAKLHTKGGEIEEAQALYETILKAFPNNKKAQQSLAGFGKTNQTNAQEPSSDFEIKQLANLFNRGQLPLVSNHAAALAKKYPNNFVIWSYAGGAHLGLGRFVEAVKCFRKVTQLNPRYPEGHNNLGSALMALGKYEESLKCFKNAVLLKSDYPDAYYNIGIAYQGLGKLNSAIAAYKKSLGLNPNNWEVNGNLGLAYKETGAWIESVAAYAKALEINPNNPELIYNLGNVLQDQGKQEEAIEAYNKAIAIKPEYAEAYTNMGIGLHEQGKLEEAVEALNKGIAINPEYAEAYYNKGNALKDQGKLEEAIEAYNKALTIKPEYAEAYSNMGIILKEQGRLEEAIEAYNKALAIMPEYAEAYGNIGVTLRDQGKLEEAIEAFNKAIAIKPEYAEAYSNMGITLHDQGKLLKAIGSFNKALAIKPEYAEAYHNKSFSLLASKDFHQGFGYAEWRWKTKEKAGNFLKSTKPFWNGEREKCVFVWGEQGIGDQIMFASIIPELYRFSSKVIVQCDDRLIPLFQRSFPDDVIYYHTNGTVLEDYYDYHIPAGSLPLKFRTTLDSFKSTSGGFLLPNKQRAEDIRKNILVGPKKNLIGLSWKTNSNVPNAQNRNIKLADLALALDSIDTQLVSLQYGDVGEEIKAVKNDLNIDIVQVSQIDNTNDIDGLASLIMACDQVVSTTNVTVHLAGAIGTKVLALLPFSPRWIWGTGSESFWYDSVSPIRQKTFGNWEDVLNSIIIR